MRSKWGADARLPPIRSGTREGVLAHPASFARLTNAPSLAHKGPMKRNPPTRAVNIRCGIIIITS
jgi:hypothetical protein